MKLWFAALQYVWKKNENMHPKVMYSGGSTGVVLLLLGLVSSLMGTLIHNFYEGVLYNNVRVAVHLSDLNPTEMLHNKYKKAVYLS